MADGQANRKSQPDAVKEQRDQEATAAAPKTEECLSKLRAGDRPYIPAGALQIWRRPDGTSGMGATLAVDPWLPDPAIAGGMPCHAVDQMLREAFPLRLICGDSFRPCRVDVDVKALVDHPDFQRRRYAAVFRNNEVRGVVDLDAARARIEHGNPEQVLTVGDICDPLDAENSAAADSPLVDYLMAADERPFRVVHENGAVRGTVDVEDLQKLPVRVLLFAKFSHLEALLVRRLCEVQPRHLEVLGTKGPPSPASSGDSGTGPERRIERLRFGELLSEGCSADLIRLSPGEAGLLERYRNNVTHGPRWYITRRGEVGELVNCFKRLSELAAELDAAESPPPS